MSETAKTWAVVFQGFFSREFMMHLAAFMLGGLLLYRNEGSDMGAILVMGAVGNYGIIRTAQKITAIKANGKKAAAPPAPPGPAPAPTT